LLLAYPIHGSIYELTGLTQEKEGVLIGAWFGESSENLRELTVELPQFVVHRFGQIDASVGPQGHLLADLIEFAAEQFQTQDIRLVAFDERRGLNHHGADSVDPPWCQEEPTFLDRPFDEHFTVVDSDLCGAGHIVEPAGHDG
jgi:hypothetical protein